MKRILMILCLAGAAMAEELPPAQSILTAARNQLPPEPVRMSGALRERAPNGFVKKALQIEMELMWGETPARAVYRIRDEKSGDLQALEILWKPEGTEYRYEKNGTAASDFDRYAAIDGLGVTWADLSFSFLWSREAQTLSSGKKLGRDCYVVSIPRPGDYALRLWIEKTTGRMLGAEEEDGSGKTEKIIKVVSVKEFDGLWMVKDLDIIRPRVSGRTSLRIDSVESF